MSYSYRLTLTTALSEEEATQLVGTIPGFETYFCPYPYQAGGRCGLIGPGIVVNVYTAHAEDIEYGLKYEGFAPDLRVSMTQKRDNEDYDLEISNVLQVTMLLLHHSAGQAILEAEESLWLRLEDNALWLNSERGLWRECQEFLPLITLPYQVAALSEA